MQNFFGTDGIRGEYGKTVTEDVAYKLGGALGDGGNIVVIGRDTRLSGASLTDALAEGIFDAGGNAINIGILPTNATAYFTRRLDADFGVMISASHNPPTDNGLKVFDRYGFKLSEAKQLEISRLMTEQRGFSGVCPPCSVWTKAQEIYLNELQTIARLNGIEVSLDCGYGASYIVAPKIFELAGAKTAVFHDKLEGGKINLRCGATCPEFLAAKAKNSPLAFSYDGDADRLAVLEYGETVEADRVFYALAKYFEQTNTLSRGIVAGTILTNVGVEKALNDIGLQLIRSDVGDGNLAALMKQKGINLGGEESGHYLLFDYATSADAVINSLVVAAMVLKTGYISEFTKELNLVPVSKIDLVITQQQKEKLLKNNFARTAAVKLNSEFPQARTVVRFSGTEPKLRFFVEANENAEKIIEKAKKLFSAAIDKTE